MNIIAVFHGAKVEGLEGLPAEISANPPMTVEGMEKMWRRISGNEFSPHLPSSLGNKIDAIYSSRLARALDTASVIALHLNLEITTVSELGQMANKDGNTVTHYPGHEKDDVILWQKNAMFAVRKIVSRHADHHTVVAVSHRPIIAGIVAWAIDKIGDANVLNKILNDPGFGKDGYFAFRTNGEHATGDYPL